MKQYPILFGISILPIYRDNCELMDNHTLFYIIDLVRL